jgi:hypothetical protein
MEPKGLRTHCAATVAVAMLKPSVHIMFPHAMVMSFLAKLVVK